MNLPRRNFSQEAAWLMPVMATAMVIPQASASSTAVPHSSNDALAYGIFWEIKDQETQTLVAKAGTYPVEGSKTKVTRQGGRIAKEQRFVLNVHIFYESTSLGSRKYTYQSGIFKVTGAQPLGIEATDISTDHEGTYQAEFKIPSVTTPGDYMITFTYGAYSATAAVSILARQR